MCPSNQLQQQLHELKTHVSRHGSWQAGRSNRSSPFCGSAAVPTADTDGSSMRVSKRPTVRAPHIAALLCLHITTKWIM